MAKKYICTDSEGRIIAVSGFKFNDAAIEAEVDDDFGAENGEPINNYIYTEGELHYSPKPMQITEDDRIAALEDAMTELLLAQYGGDNTDD